MTQEDDDYLQRIYETMQLVEERKRLPAIERDAWIMAARRLFAPGPRQPCFVCNKFQSIAQAHHAVPLTMQYDRGFKYPDNEHVWLCPNHHAMAHMFIQDDSRSMARDAMRARGRRMSALHPDVSEGEFKKLIELMRLAARGPEFE